MKIKFLNLRGSGTKLFCHLAVPVQWKRVPNEKSVWSPLKKKTQSTPFQKVQNNKH